MRPPPRKDASIPTVPSARPATFSSPLRVPAGESILESREELADELHDWPGLRRHHRRRRRDLRHRPPETHARGEIHGRWRRIEPPHLVNCVEELPDPGPDLRPGARI